MSARRDVRPRRGPAIRIAVVASSRASVPPATRAGPPDRPPLPEPPGRSWAGLRNEVAYRLGWERAPLLLFANLELTNRCNLQLHLLPHGQRTHAPPARSHGPRVCSSGRSQVPARSSTSSSSSGASRSSTRRFADLARRARVAGARTFVTTNGTLLDDRRVASLLDAGLDRVTVSVDGDATTHEAVRGVPLRACWRGLASARSGRATRGAAPTGGRRVDGGRAGDRGGVGDFRGPAFAWRRRSRADHPPAHRGRTPNALSRALARGPRRAPGRPRDGVLRRPRRRARRGRRADATTCARSTTAPGCVALRRAHVDGRRCPPICARCTEYPTDAAAPRFSAPEEASRRRPGGRA